MLRVARSSVKLFSKIATRSWLTSNEVLIFLVFFAFQTVFLRSILADADVGWHLRGGEYILKHFTIPANDPWSFSSSQRWYNISWLWDVMAFLIFDRLGSTGTVLFNNALYSGLLVLGYKLHIEPLKVHSKAKIDTIIIAGLVMYPFAFFRPQIVGLYMVVICMWLFKTHHKKSIWWVFPILMLIWQNMHGSFIMGFTIAGAFALQYFYNKDYTGLKNIVLGSLLALAVLPINPLKLDIITAVSRTLDSDISSRILEWKPFQFGHIVGMSVFVSIVIMLGNIRTKSVPLAERLLFFFWLFAGLVSMRYLVFAQFIGLSLFATWLGTLRVKSYKLSPTMRLPLVALLIVTPMIKLVVFDTQKLPLNPSEDAVLFIRDNYHGLNILNDYNSGGYFIFHMRDKNKLFVDGRAGTAYEESILNFSIGMLEGVSDWDKVFERYQIDGILLPSNLLERIDIKMFFTNWKKSYTGISYSVLVRPEYVNDRREEQ